jgi:hypothetical protein
MCATTLLVLAGAGVVTSISSTITPSGIIIHHSAVPLAPGHVLDIKALDEIHRKRGFGVFYWGRFYHVGYHYLILPDGTVQDGRPEHCRGSHATGYNSFIGICLVGNFSQGRAPREEYGPAEPTAAQLRSLTGLINRLRANYNIPPERVMQHHDVNPNTECPGEHFPFPWLKSQLQAFGT